MRGEQYGLALRSAHMCILCTQTDCAGEASPPVNLEEKDVGDFPRVAVKENDERGICMTIWRMRTV